MIRIEHLTKKFDTVCAVNDVSMEIPEGIMYGLLGTNGAGKSGFLVFTGRFRCLWKRFF